jgi:uncharacterized protein YggU (UPF0235/DUF167 family)
MPSKKYAFHDGKSGAALAIRVTPRSSANQVDEILNNGTIRVRLIASGNDHEINQALITFLGDVLEIPTTKIEIVAGEAGRDKLISILDMDVESVHQQILDHLK